MEPLRVWIHGKSGKMGHALARCLANEGTSFVLQGGSAHGDMACAGLDNAQLILDFSGIEGSRALCHKVREMKLAGKSILVGSTGLPEDLVNEWQLCAREWRNRVLFAPNTSVGILIMTRLLTQITQTARIHGFDIEVEETHHRHKKDAPSGTAKLLVETICAQDSALKSVSSQAGERLQDTVGVHATRGGGVFGEHTVRFLGDHEEIAISHRAFSRDLFAQGAISLSKWLLKQEFGRSYTLDDVQI